MEKLLREVPTKKCVGLYSSTSFLGLLPHC